MPRISRSADLESGMVQNRDERKKNLPLIIGLVLSLIAAIVFMAVFIVYYNKYNDNKTASDDAKTLIDKMSPLIAQLINTTTSTRPNSEPILLTREIKMGKDADNKVYVANDKEDFKVMQFNMLADGLCGLYDDNYLPKTDQFSKAMEPQNQHYLYWRYRLPLIAEEITKYDAGIVTIQENDHHEEIELVLNLKAQPTKEKPEKPKETGKPEKPEEPEKPELKILWKCVNQENQDSLIGKMTYLPKGKNKTDNATICWRTDRFDYDEKATKQGNYTTIDLDKEEVEAKKPYVVVKLTHKATKKDVYVATTKLESQKTLYGELIRLNQIDQLMQVLKADEKTDEKTPVILSADLSTGYEAKTVNPAPKAAAMYLDGKWKCQIGTKTGDAEVKYEDLDNVVIKGESMKSSTGQDATIKYGVDGISINAKGIGFTLEKNTATFKSEVSGEDSVQYTLYCADDLTAVPHEKPATLLLGRLSGKVFYDSYNQKYEIGTLAKAEDTEVKMTVAEKEYKIKYETGKYSIIDAENTALYTIEGEHEWKWTDANDTTKFLVWSPEEIKELYQFNYNPSTYNYLTGADNAVPDESVLTAFENHVSMVKDVGYASYTAKQTSLRAAYADKITKMTKIEKSISSQKELSPGDAKKEPDYTYLALLGDANDAPAALTPTSRTEDYIFNTEKLLLPVGYLEIPAEDKVKEIGYYPNYKYPSDHISIMTQYRFNKSE